MSGVSESRDENNNNSHDENNSNSRENNSIVAVSEPPVSSVVVSSVVDNAISSMTSALTTQLSSLSSQFNAQLSGVVTQTIEPLAKVVAHQGKRLGVVEAEVSDHGKQLNDQGERLVIVEGELASIKQLIWKSKNKSPISRVRQESVEPRSLNYIPPSVTPASTVASVSDLASTSTSSSTEDYGLDIWATSKMHDGVSFVLVPTTDELDISIFKPGTIYSQNEVLVASTAAPNSLEGVKFVILITGCGSRGAHRGTWVTYKDQTNFIVTGVKKNRVDLMEMKPTTMAPTSATLKSMRRRSEVDALKSMR